MNLVIPLHQIRDQDRGNVGGKAFSLAALTRLGMRVSDALCVTSEAYRRFTAMAGLRERILLELNRKNFQEMRWEEMWDAALRIRNMFLNSPFPPELSGPIGTEIEGRFKRKSVVVRSSAPGEDSSRTSFAGLHESYVNVRGTEAILEHIKLVWASLWSDAALLYRQELGLDFETSTMAVLVQEIVIGERSGVVFGKNPNDGSQAVVEAVHGLNAGLVDGTVEPDRWILDRKTGIILSRTPAKREKRVVPMGDGIRLEPLPPAFSGRPPLTDGEVMEVFTLALRSEKHFGAPQDLEWTFKEEGLYVLQSRPITTAAVESPDDQRPWYLSLRRSFENLKALRQRIESELIPGMVEEADRLGRNNLKSLPDAQLADEIKRRMDIHERWVGVYWKDFIPFAHGMRLFGQFYNDRVRPQDPYEFMSLLGNSQLASLERNRMLDEMASMIRSDSALEEKLRAFHRSTHPAFNQALRGFIEKFGDLSCSIEGEMQCTQGEETILRLLLELATHASARGQRPSKDIETLTSGFLARFEGEQRKFAAELLDLGRASYRLRDDDNIYLGRIERQMLAALDEGRGRVGKRLQVAAESIETTEVMEALKHQGYLPRTRPSTEKAGTQREVKARQMVGQPAGPGIAEGLAHVVLSPSDLFDFKAEEILVCDAVEPNMTFVVPLASAIVERRGGMLIHGAIIAREYGLPCVTGVPDATRLIRTGDSITVDGYLGIVIIG